MSVRFRRILAGLAAVATVAAGCVLAAPAQAAVPPLQLTLLVDVGAGTTDAPFVGQEIIAQSQSLSVPPGRDGWSCVVTFGDGTSGGFWRAQPFQPSAPCAAISTYTAAGTYTLTMTVTDPTGASSTVSKVLHVRPRPITTVDGGVEGRATTLTAPAAASSVRWTARSPRCYVTDPTGPDTVARCAGDGTYRFDYDTGAQATSGGYDVTYRNGAPRPTVKPIRFGTNGGAVTSPRVGTGDTTVISVVAHDPSTLPPDGTRSIPTGDTITCAFRYGNGQRETVTADAITGRCNGYVVYLTPGTRTVQVTVTDQDGAGAIRTTDVQVVRRDVFAAARGTTTDGTDVAVNGWLTKQGVEGSMWFKTAAGEVVSVDRITALETTLDGQVRLQGAATLNGDPGYRMDLTIWRKGPLAVSGALYAVDPSAPYDPQVGRVEADRGVLTTHVEAPVIR